MKIFNQIQSISEEIKCLKMGNKIISLVPTMGFLHEGHLSLIQKAKKNSDVVVVSIFVNKEQFNAVDDYQNYPQNLTNDLKKLEELEVDIVFCPKNSEIYPDKKLIGFKINELTNNLCAKFRPNHFEGVVLIVTKLFNIIKPDIAVFGEKDFQQLQIIKKITQDLNFDIKIIAVPTVRRSSGLALSSRNSRLSLGDQQKSANIFAILSKIKNDITDLKTASLTKILNKYKKELELDFYEVEYLQICDEKYLQIINNFDTNISCRIFVAVTINQIRLIDNLKIN